MHLGETIRKNLDAFMQAANLNQVELAKLSGLKQPVVSRALSGAMNNVETKTLEALAKGVGCMPYQLIRPDVEPDPLLGNFLNLWRRLDDSERNTMITLATQLVRSKAGDEAIDPVG